MTFVSFLIPNSILSFYISIFPDIYCQREVSKSVEEGIRLIHPLNISLHDLLLFQNIWETNLKTFEELV